jgi:hypothetical protein
MWKDRTWKDLARPFVRPLPQWSTVAVAPPQQTVIAVLHWDGQSADVTADHTVASLKPLAIATSLDAGQRPVLEYRDSATGRLLGVLRLARSASIATENTSLTLYHVTAGEHRCLGWPRRPWNTWLQNRLMRKNRASNHLNMAPAVAQQLMIAYLCPRPVILVSVDAPGHRNIFPMDLIGPLERSGLFSLALRSTNVSVPTMRDVRRVALSSIPATMKTVVYKLAEHHKQPLPDWDALPFPVAGIRHTRRRRGAAHPGTGHRAQPGDRLAHVVPRPHRFRREPGGGHPVASHGRLSSSLAPPAGHAVCGGLGH